MYKIFLYLFITLPLLGSSQSLMVVEKTTQQIQSLEGVIATSLDGSKAAISNSEGIIQIPVKYGDSLILRLIGYNPDTSIFTQGVDTIFLTPSTVLSTVEVTGAQNGTLFSMNTIQTEIITASELKKAACCNLGESFETNNTVDIKITDALFGNKELNILGLSGSYSPIYIESTPQIFGLNQSNGLNTIPGTSINQIALTKGSASVMNGAESTSGFIEVDLLNPTKENGAFANVYVDEFNRKELNFHTSFNPKTNLNGLLIAHGSHTLNNNDRNKDGFRDVPWEQNIGLLNKWNYNYNSWFSQNSVSLQYQNKQAGQSSAQFTPEDALTSGLYSQELTQQSASFYGKTGYVFPNNTYMSIGNVYLLKTQENEGYFGLKSYSGTEKRAYLKSFFTHTPIEELSYNLGFNIHYIDYLEHIDTFSQSLHDNQLGVFIEDTWKINPQLEVISGIRFDQIQSNCFILPRIHSKFSFSEYTNIKVSYGQSAKSYFVLAENPNLLASNRNIVIEETLKPEKAENYRMSFTTEGRLLGKHVSLLLDGSYTFFQNKITPDYEKVFYEVHFSNRENITHAKAAQADFLIHINRYLYLKFSHKIQQVAEKRASETWVLPLIPSNKSLVQADIFTLERKLNFTLKLERNGSKRLPNLPVEYANDNAGIVLNRSNPYLLLGGIVNYEPSKRLRIYAGIDNILNNMQEVQLLGLDAPLGTTFDTGYIWGPTMGRKIYLGISLQLKK